MSGATTHIIAPDFLAVTIGIVVYLVGVAITRRVAFLRNFNIPEPVTGGVLAAVVLLLVYLVFQVEVGFDLSTRDRLLVIFFATVGVNARLSVLATGGRVLAILCVVTVVYVFIQNGVGVAGANLFGLPPAAGVMLGSVALVGGHGTTVAWAPIVAAEHGFPAAMETGIAVATLGLIVASLLGGPIAKFLIEKRGLAPAPVDAAVDRLSERVAGGQIDKVGFMHALLVVNVAVILGFLVHGWITSVSAVRLPLFVPCLLMGILLSNTVPLVFRRWSWPAGTASLDLIAGYSLSVFLAMSLMSMQLWTLAHVAGPVLMVVAAQTLVAAAYILLIVFPVLGKDYQAAVLCGGFTGLSLGATPTAIANMTATTNHYGPSPNAFIILPLVSAFFVDLVNVVAITLFLPS
ncbi:MAG: Glutamate permease [Pseudomonadota bacterium]|jgi:ESS family glutamate:Na+ symporter